MRLLVTGFGPFPKMPVNPSAAVARAVAASPRWRLLGVAPRALALTTAYAALAAELDPALASAPDAMMLVGVAGRARKVRIEIRATARRSTLFADAGGRTAATPRGGGEARRTQIAPPEALVRLARRGIPVRLSRDAGRYLCNAAYHRALALACPVLFVHIPRSPDRSRAGPRAKWPLGWEARLAAALVDLGILLLRDARLHDAGRVARSAMSR